MPSRNNFSTSFLVQCLFALFFLFPPSFSVFTRPSTRPHIVVFIVDDVGWTNVGYHALTKAGISTPTIDQLAAQGIKLERHYAHCLCSPSRSAFQSGRYPVNVNLENNAADPEVGVSLRMTTIGEKLQSVGYSTHFLGKWHCGVATPNHNPIRRGYNTSFHYWGAFNGPVNHVVNMNCPDGHDGYLVDLWDNTKPANRSYNGIFEDTIFRQGATSIIQDYIPSPQHPLFLVYSSRIAHTPYQLPVFYYNSFKFGKEDINSCCMPGDTPQTINQKFCGCRSLATAMIRYLDDSISLVVDQLKAKNIWNNTLLLFTSDNGAPIGKGPSGTNNYPLRGAKTTTWEGGIRVPAFLSGGFIPQNLRGTKLSEITHIADWYTTFARLAHADPVDHRAAQAQLPPVDGIDLWPILSRQTTVKRQIPISGTTLIRNQYKLLLGTMHGNFWTGPVYPNHTSVLELDYEVSLNCTNGCLFNVVKDRSEYHDISASNPQRVKSMISTLKHLRTNFFGNTKKDLPTVKYFPSKTDAQNICEMSKQFYNGSLGPWRNITASFLLALKA